MIENQVILRDWVLAILPRIKRDGIMVVPDRSPLTIEQIVEVLEEVRTHPAYQRQTISVPDAHGYRAILGMTGDGHTIEFPATPDPEGRVMPPGSIAIGDYPDTPNAPPEDL